MTIKFSNDDTLYSGEIKIISNSIIRIYGEDIPKNDSGFKVIADDGSEEDYTKYSIVFDYNDEECYVEFTNDNKEYYIYVHSNENGYVSGYIVLDNNSEVPEGYLLLKHGKGREFKFPSNSIILDSDGFFIYKINNGELEQTTNDEKQVFLNARQASIFQFEKKNKILLSKDLLSNYLLTHPLKSSCHNNTEGTYSVTTDKQSLMTSNYLTYNLAKECGIEQKLTWNETGKECEEWTETEFLQLILEVSNYVKPLVSKQQYYEKLINSCASKEELDAIEIVYD